MSFFEKIISIIIGAPIGLLFIRQLFKKYVNSKLDEKIYKSNLEVLKKQIKDIRKVRGKSDEISNKYKNIRDRIDNTYTE